MQSIHKDREKGVGMKTNSKKLEEIRKENPFRVPENYFEHFNQEIMNRLPEKDFFCSTNSFALGQGETVGLYGCHVFRTLFHYPVSHHKNGNTTNSVSRNSGTSHCAGSQPILVECERQ